MVRLKLAAEALVIPLGALLVSAVLFGLFIAAVGKSPVELYQLMYKGGFGTWFSWQNTLQRAAPLLLTALCVAVPAQLGLVVIGGDRPGAGRARSAIFEASTRPSPACCSPTSRLRS